MIRKQIYLDDESERKLKALARSRGCSEAEVIRLALRSLPEPPAGVDAALEAAGFLEWVPGEGDEVPDETGLASLHRQLADPPAGRQVHMTEAILEGREDRI